MKKILIMLLLLPIVLASIPQEEKAETNSQIKLIVQYINDQDADKIIDLLSPNANPELKNKIINSLNNKLNFEQDITSYEYIDNKIKASGKFYASGKNWNINGFKSYYTFEKVDDEWLLLDTNFYEKISPEFGFKIFKTIGIIFLISIPFLILFGIFWIWMIIDITKREFDNKLVWLILVILLGFVGAVVYFFAIRMKLKKNNKK